MFNPSANSINCTFLNQQDTSEKQCNITYGQCLQSEKQSAQGSATGLMKSIILPLSLDGHTQLCYSVTASNDTYTVVVEGSLMIGKQFK